MRGLHTQRRYYEKKMQVTEVNSKTIKNKGICTVQWTVIAMLCCVVVSSPGLWPQTHSLTSL